MSGSKTNRNDHDAADDNDDDNDDHGSGADGCGNCYSIFLFVADNICFRLLWYQTSPTMATSKGQFRVGEELMRRYKSGALSCQVGLPHATILSMPQ